MGQAMQNDVHMGVGEILLNEEQENHQPKLRGMDSIVKNPLYWWDHTQIEMDYTHQSSSQEHQLGSRRGWDHSFSHEVCLNLSSE